MRTPSRPSLILASVVLLLLWATALDLGADQGPARLIRDINRVPSGDMASFPAAFAQLGGITLFEAQTPETGRELWRTDGTAAGTVLVRDIAPGPLSAFGLNNDSAFNVVGNTAYFAADDGVHGVELWKSDGTEAGTVLVRDIRPGRPSSLLRSTFRSGDLLWSLLHARIGGTLLFLADDGVHGFEPWTTDGTEAGTRLLADVRPGRISAFGEFNDIRFESASLGGVVIFGADDGVHGSEPWRSDGTGPGTFPLDVVPGGIGSAPRELTRFDDVVVFVSNGGLWRTDGTAAGTFVIGSFSGPGRLLAVDHTLYFRASAGTTGEEPWKSDGTASGTVMVKDIHPSGRSSPDWLVAVGGMLLFVADDGLHGRELWRTDGTEAGTVLVRDIRPGSASTTMSLRGAIGDVLCLMVDDGVHGFEPWRTDGTEAGTRILADIEPGVASSSATTLALHAGSLFFSAQRSDVGYELWRTAGTEDGTVLVADIYSGLGSSFPGSSSPVRAISANDALLFRAEDPVHGIELWRSDGTPAGTKLVRDINPRIHTRDLSFSRALRIGTAASSFRFLFVANDGINGSELWVSDGTEAGTLRVKDIRPGAASGIDSGGSLTVLGDNAVFFADDGVHGRELWTSDGTEDGTVLLKDVHTGPSSALAGSPVPFDGALYFAATDAEHGRELWRTDGTAAGTVLVRDIRPGPEESSPSVLKVFRGALYFAADDGQHGMELWRSDGTESGTNMVQDLDPGPGSSQIPLQFFAWGDRLYFPATDPLHGIELWTSDGTESGTALVADINPGPARSVPYNFLSHGDSLYFSAGGASVGFELWKTDGTETGTVLVRDINPAGDSEALGRSRAALGDKLLFDAVTWEHGRELWTSDGTEAGTVLLRDMLPGENSSNPRGLTPVDGALVFSAQPGPSSPSRLWRTDGTDEGTWIVLDTVSNPTELTAVSGIVLLAATDATIGQEPHVTDGTEAGTIALQDIAPGASGSRPGGFLFLGSRILFLADDGVVGRELWIARTAIFLRQPARAIDALRAEVVSLGLALGTERSLVAKLDAAAVALSENRRVDAIVAVRDFIRHVDAQSGKRIDATLAAELVEFASDLVSLLEGAFD